MRKLLLIALLLGLIIRCSVKAYKAADDWSKRPERAPIIKHYNYVSPKNNL